MFKKKLIKFVSLLMLILSIFGLDYLSANYVLSYQDMSLFLVGLHRGISNDSLNIRNTDQSGILYSLKQIKDYSAVSVISMLEFSAMKEVVLDRYLSDAEQLLNDTSFIINDLRQTISLLESDMNSCSKEKNLYDKQFFEAIDFYDIEYMEESLKKSIDAEKCVGENRIRMNSKRVLLDQFNYYYDFIKIKYDYLILKRDVIVRNFDFMKNGLLDELVETKEVLNQLDN